MNSNSLFITALLSLVGFQAIGLAQLETGLVGYWQFDVNGFDSSTTAADLDLVGNPDFGVGLIGCAMHLNGNPAQFVQESENATIFDLGDQDFSIQFWVNFDTVGGEQTLIEKFTGGAGPGYTLTKLSSNQLQFFAAGLSVISSPVAGISAGTWHQIILRRIGANIEIFFDGVSLVQSNQNGPVTPSPNPLLIGERNGSQQFPLRGLVDEVAFWKRGLANEEIGNLYNDGHALAMVPKPTFLPGDVNLDGSVNLLDVAPFIDLLSTGQYQQEADMNQDCSVNLLDISGFIEAVGGN